ncbi:MAG: DUF2063 domain-containing protein [Dehalococcoidia bacterium]
MQRQWADAQTAFAVALIDPRLPPPSGIIQCGSGRRRGFAVYRNNSMVTLIDALQERFPVTYRLVGEEFFRAMAGAYASEHRPRSPLLLDYGDAFPTFIHTFVPAKDVPYLSDLAQLEVAWSRAYHAPEANPLPLQVLAEIDPTALLEKRLTLHPSMHLLRAEYPVADIWAAHQHACTPAPPARWDGQDVLILRPHAEAQVRTLGRGVYALIGALLDHRCVHDAAEMACLDNPDFEAGESIVELFRMGAVVALVSHEDEEKRS